MYYKDECTCVEFEWAVIVLVIVLFNINVITENPRLRIVIL